MRSRGLILRKVSTEYRNELCIDKDFRLYRLHKYSIADASNLYVGIVYFRQELLAFAWG